MHIKRRLASALLATLMLLPAAVFGAEAAWAQTGQLMLEGFPPLTGEGFLPEGEPEYVHVDPEAGQWRYASQGLRIVISRVSTLQGRHKLRYLAAHVFVRQGEPAFRMHAYDRDHPLEARDLYKEKPYLIAAKHGLVLCLDGDYYINRIWNKRSAGKGYAVGVVVRDGAILLDDPPGERHSRFPPLDLMALFADGGLKVFDRGAHSAEALVQQGAADVLSFGPWLVRDGLLNERLARYGSAPDPRVGIGMYAPGHYLALVAEGRIKQSRGLSIEQFGQLFQELGCPTAFNLDGGWTSAMVFMGKQLNQLDDRGVFNNARTQNEVLGIGHTNAYPEGGK